MMEDYSNPKYWVFINHISQNVVIIYMHDPTPYDKNGWHHDLGFEWISEAFAYAIEYAILREYKVLAPYGGLLN